MSTSNLPSGPWTGFFNYAAGGQRHRMDLSLSFEKGRITGEGADNVGVFVIDGAYNGDDGECWWTKSYVGRHDVAYTGFCDSKGIWGTWEIDCVFHGGFRIWPVGDEPAEALAEVVEQPTADALVQARAKVE